MGEAEDRLYELALAGKQATQEYKDLMAATQNYLRTQQEVDLQVDAGSMPMAQKLTTAVGGVAGAFGAAEGAIALFGVESKAMQETLLKLNALLAITSGMVAIKEAIPIFTDFKNTVVNSFNAMTTAGKAFAITGIGLLITGLAVLSSNWNKVKEALSSTTVAQKVNNQVTLQATTSIAAELNAASKLQKQLKDETLTRNQKNIKVKEFQKAYPGLLQNMNIESMSIDQINEQLIKNIDLLKLQAKQKAIASLREEQYKKQLEAQVKPLTELTTATDDLLSYGNQLLAGGNATLTQLQLGNKRRKETIETTNKQINALDELEKANDKEILALQFKGAQSKRSVRKIKRFTRKNCCC
jgi:hypothetical protein